MGWSPAVAKRPGESAGTESGEHGPLPGGGGATGGVGGAEGGA